MIFIWWLFFVDYGLFVGFLWVVSVGFRWGFFWLLFLFFLLNDKTQFCFFSNSLISCHTFFEAEYDPNWTAEAVLAQAARRPCDPKPDLTWDHEISLYPTPSWTARFTLKLIREICFTGFPTLSGTAYFAYMVWHCWNCERSWTFPRVPVVEPASSASHHGGWQCPLGRDVVPGHANRCEAEDPGITGSVAQAQAAKPLGPHFSVGREPGF